MNTDVVVLALLRDDADATFWKIDFEAIPGIVVTATGESVVAVCHDLAELNLSPGFIIVSSRIYPDGQAMGIEALRNLYPAAEILIVSPATDPLPSVSPLLRDGVRNLVVAPAAGSAGSTDRTCSALGMAVSSLAAGRERRMATCLRPGTVIREFLLTSSSQKEMVLTHLDKSVEGESAEVEFLRQRAALIADEMIENALYGAPRDSDGTRLFKKGECRELLAGERIVFRFGFDGENLAMEVADGWGSLRPEDVIDHFKRNRERDGLPPMDGGLGLFLIWRFMDHLHVSISPGRETVVGGHVKLASPDGIEEIKGFHITASSACM